MINVTVIENDAVLDAEDFESIDEAIVYIEEFCIGLDPLDLMFRCSSWDDSSDDELEPADEELERIEDEP